jgi:hypothetical protein
MLHNEGITTRNYQLQLSGSSRRHLHAQVDGTVTGHRIAPARSACALVSSQMRTAINSTTSNNHFCSGISGQAFSTFVPHTVRAKKPSSAAIARFRRERQ